MPPSQRILEGKAKYYANTSNKLAHDKLTSAGSWSFIAAVALNISTKAKVSSRMLPGGNANSIRVLRGNSVV